jgi:hypothetical protein
MDSSADFKFFKSFQPLPFFSAFILGDDTGRMEDGLLEFPFPER